MEGEGQVSKQGDEVAPHGIKAASVEERAMERPFFRFATRAAKAVCSRPSARFAVDVAGHQAADLLQREPSSCQPGALRRWTDERLVRIVHKPEHRSELVFEAWVLFFEKAFKARELCADSG